MKRETGNSLLVGIEKNSAIGACDEESGGGGVESNLRDPLVAHSRLIRVLGMWMR
jgi:hypothetical protein